MSLAPTPDDESLRRPEGTMEPKVGWLKKAMVLGQMGSRVKETTREVSGHRPLSERYHHRLGPTLPYPTAYHGSGSARLHSTFSAADHR